MGVKPADGKRGGRRSDPLSPKEVMWWTEAQARARLQDIIQDIVQDPPRRVPGPYVITGRKS